MFRRYIRKTIKTVEDWIFLKYLLFDLTLKSRARLVNWLVTMPIMATRILYGIWWRVKVSSSQVSWYPLKSTQKYTPFRQQLLQNTQCITYFFHIGMGGTDSSTYLPTTARLALFSYLYRGLWFPSSFLGAHQRMCVEVRRTSFIPGWWGYGVAHFTAQRMW